MILLHRLSKISALVLLAAAATGCVVLPWGHHRGGHGGRHHYGAQATQPPVVQGQAQGPATVQVAVR